jgi:hypothetical protein
MVEMLGMMRRRSALDGIKLMLLTALHCRAAETGVVLISVRYEAMQVEKYW